MRARAFTLTEILIVIGLIVLMIALAVPALNFITGNRSVDAAQNTISAYLGRARAEAIGLQEVRGVFFFIEKSTGNVAMILVREATPPTAGTFFPNPLIGPAEPRPEVWLDIVPDAEAVTLQSGIGLQVIDDAAVDDMGKRIEDGYIGFNTRNVGNSIGDQTDRRTTHTWYGGVILFDGSGQLVSRRYAFKTFFFVLPTSEQRPTRMGDLLFRPAGDTSPDTEHHTPAGVYDVVPMAVWPPSMGLGSESFPKSHLGVILFDRAAMAGAVPLNPTVPQPRDHDWQFHIGATYDQGTAWDEASEERWLDDNGLPLLVNRYNGTLVRAQ